MADALFGQVKLLLGCNGTNGSTTFTDASWGNRTVTANGNAQVSTTAPKFGTGSALFDGTGDYLTIPTSTEFDTGATGDFTVECWVKTASTDKYIFSRVPSNVTFGKFAMYITAAGKLGGVFSFAQTSWNVNLTSTQSINTNAWVHIAFNKTGDVYTIYVDGVVGATSTVAGSNSASTTALSLGATANGTGAMVGNIDSARFTVGTGRYPAAFTPPTAEFELGVIPSMTVALTAPSPLTAMSFGGYANLTAPTGTAALKFGTLANLTAPMGQVTAVFGGVNINQTAPMGVLDVHMRDNLGDNAAFLTAPKGTLEAVFGSVAKLTAPKPTLSATMTGDAMLQAEIEAPMGLIDSTGTGSPYIMEAELDAPMGNMVGYGGAVVAIEAPMGTITATGTVGGVMHAALTVPLFELTAAITRNGMMSANLIAPMPGIAPHLQAYLVAPMGQLTAIGSATITATYEAYAVNLLHPPQARGQAAPIDETTRYTNFPFTHVVRYRNSYYGANSTGLYLLEGTTDDGVDIPYTVRTAISDFKSPFRKTVASAYFGGRLGPDATMTLYAGEGAQTQAYSYTTPRGVLAQNYRQAFGKGIRQHRYYAVGISGTDAMALDSLELDTHNMTRRI